MTEDELLSNVLYAAKLLRWRRYHVRNSRAGIIQGESGFPDLVLLRPPRLLIVELKAPKGRTTPEQREWLAGFLDVPCLEVAIWRPDDWLTGTIERVLA